MNGEISESEVMFKLIRIFVAQYLSSVHNIKGFEQQAINIISKYIFRIVNKLTVQTKKLVNMQGRTQPNCLHLVDTIEQSRIIQPIKLVNFLIKQREQSRGIKFQYIAFQNLSKRIFQTQTQQINGCEKEIQHPNIRSIPYNYTVNLKKNSLTLRSPIDEAFKKPEEYTYKIHHETIEKSLKNVEQLGNYSARETRKYLGILNLKNQEDEQNTNEKPKKRKQIDPDKFDMINYI